jgi:peptidoglycan/LPS O-acetylase OafA/YrhL
MLDHMNVRASNSYDFVRFCAASAVLFSHQFALSLRPEPAVPLYGEDFGKLAVEVFFCLSGFLICQSLRKNPDWAEFLCARFLRIVPNLTFSLVVTTLGTMIWYHNYSHLWQHIKFVIGNLLMFVRGVTYVIPGVFEDAVGGPAVNGPLWSLPSELWLYILLFLFFLIGGRRNGLLILIGTILLSILWAITPVIGDKYLGPFTVLQFSGLGTYFLCGALLATCWERIKRQALPIGLISLVAMLILRNVLPVNTILQALTLAMTIICLGSSGAMAWFSRAGDASYGMYIFAWPIQQFCLLLIGTFWTSMAIAFLLTTLLGYATWHSFEKRAMSVRKQAAAELRTILRRVFSRAAAAARGA